MRTFIGLLVTLACSFRTTSRMHVEAFAPLSTRRGGSVTTLRRSSESSVVSLAMADTDSSEVYIMVNGMPGPMATAAAEACLRKGLKLSPFAMTGPDIEPCTITVVDSVSGKSSNVRLIPSNQREEIVKSLAGIRESAGAENVMAIDYTHPSAVNGNALFYKENGLPFVMGTTGGDRDKLIQDVPPLIDAIALLND